MAEDMTLDDEGVRRSARSQLIIDTIERALDKMMFVESNIGRDIEAKDLFQVKREAQSARGELQMAFSLLTGKLEV